MSDFSCSGCSGPLGLRHFTLAQTTEDAYGSVPMSFICSGCANQDTETMMRLAGITTVREALRFLYEASKKEATAKG